MPLNASAAYTADVQSVNGDDVVVTLLTITHPQLLGQFLRVCNDTQDLTHQGNVYTAAPFEVTLPDDRDGQPPRAVLRFGNVGRDLMRWLELSNGGAGARCTVSVVRRSLPNAAEITLTVDLQSVSADINVVTAELGYDTLLDRAAVGLRYDPAVAPGIF